MNDWIWLDENMDRWGMVGWIYIYSYERLEIVGWINGWAMIIKGYIYGWIWRIKDGEWTFGWCKMVGWIHGWKWWMEVGWMNILMNMRNGKCLVGYMYNYMHAYEGWKVVRRIYGWIWAIENVWLDIYGWIWRVEDGWMIIWIILKDEGLLDEYMDEYKGWRMVGWIYGWKWRMEDGWINIWMKMKDGGWLDDYIVDNEGWRMVGWIYGWV